MHCGIELTKYIKWKPVKFNGKHTIKLKDLSSLNPDLKYSDRVFYNIKKKPIFRHCVMC